MCSAFRSFGVVCLALCTALSGECASDIFGFRLIPLAAQSPATPGQIAAAPRLLITVLEGEGAVNNIKARTAREPVVEVTDENHKPVAGALVTFFAPSNGPGGAFAGQQSLSVTTDQAGRAVGHGFHPNHASGQFKIEVTASYGTEVAKATILETNLLSSAAAGSTAAGAAHAGILGTKFILIFAVAAAAGTAGAVYGVTHSGNNAPTATISGPGTATVGAGH